MFKKMLDLLKTQSKNIHDMGLRVPEGYSAYRCGLEDGWRNARFINYSRLISENDLFDADSKFKKDYALGFAEGLKIGENGKS